MKTSWLQHQLGTIRSKQVVLGLMVALAAALTLAIGVYAAQAAATIDQCANGTFASPAVCTGAQWQNGDLNINNSHYREGDSVPFRVILTALNPGQAYTVTIDWQYLNGNSPHDAHAYDYLTTYNRTETTADPCNGVSGCSLATFTTINIPVDNFTLAAACNPLNVPVTPVAGVFTLFGGTLNSLGQYQTQTCGTGNQNQFITIFFTAGSANEVLAWGGHIGSQADWGAGNSATSISGSPYHMALTSCSFGCGSQDRAMKAGAQPLFTTQSTTAAAATKGSATHDTLNLAGNIGGSTIAGTATFYLCTNPVPPYTPNPTCTVSPNNRTAVGSPVNVNIVASGSNNPSGSVNSPDFTPTKNGSYCWAVDFVQTSGSLYPSFTNLSNLTTECFLISTPTAVTVSSIGAEAVGGMNWAALAFGGMGLVVLGGMVVFVIRRR